MEVPEKTRVLFQDDFGDGIQSIPELSGTGAFSEAGGKLIYDLSSGVNGDWWTFGRNSRAAALYFGPSLGLSYDIVVAEATFSAFSGATYSELYFNLYKGDVDWYQFYIDSGGVNLRTRRMVGAAVTDYASVARPAYPFRVRLVWNTVNNTMEWWYNDLLGGGWVLLQSAVSTGSFAPEQVLFGAKNWNSLPAVHGEWDDLLVEASLASSLRRSVEVATVEDVITLSGRFRRPGEADAVEVRDVVDLTRVASEGLGRAAFGDARTETLLKRFGHVVGAGAFASDSTLLRLGTTAQFNGIDPTLDGEGHPHFTVSGACLWARVLDLRKGAGWVDPVGVGLTGYAKDGKRYTAGVQDPGPVWAPWASEAASNNRSSRPDAPDQVLACLCYASASSYELVLFDLDTFPATFDVWMRFLPKTSYSMLGNFTTLPWDVAFFDGMLAIVLHATVGRLHLLDFRSDGQDCACFIGSDDHWLALAGKTLVNRNDDGGWYTTNLSGRPELRLENENPKRVEMSGDETRIWAVMSGEDAVDVVGILGSVPQGRVSGVIDQSPANVDPRITALSPDGWLWFSVQNRVVRNLMDYREGLVVDPGSGSNQFTAAQLRFFRQATLPHVVTSMCATRNWVFCGTEVGVYRVHKVDLTWALAYTVAGGGGGGRQDSPPAGEILLGSNPEVLRISAITAEKSSYLLVASDGGDGGVTVIRLYDDVVVFSKDYDSGLRESGAKFCAGEF